MIIEEGTHEAGFCLIAAQLLLVRIAERRDFRVRAVAQELVAERNVIVDAIIHVAHPSVVGVPLHERDVGHVVAREPRVSHLVRRTFLKVEEGTHISCQAQPHSSARWCRPALKWSRYAGIG